LPGDRLHGGSVLLAIVDTERTSPRARQRPETHLRAR
jgi:hypothetical protein